MKEITSKQKDSYLHKAVKEEGKCCRCSVTVVKEHLVPFAQCERAATSAFFGGDAPTRTLSD